MFFNVSRQSPSGNFSSFTSGMSTESSALSLYNRHPFDILSRTAFTFCTPHRVRGVSSYSEIVVGGGSCSIGDAVKLDTDCGVDAGVTVGATADFGVGAGSAPRTGGDGAGVAVDAGGRATL